MVLGCHQVPQWFPTNNCHESDTSSCCLSWSGPALASAPGPTALPPSDDTEDYGALLLRCSSGLRPTLRLSHLNLDGLGLGFLTLGQGQGQNAVLVLGLNILRVDRIGQREGTRKAPVAPLDAMITLLFHVPLELALSADEQGLVFDADLDILRIDARQLCLDHQVLL